MNTFIHIAISGGMKMRGNNVKISRPVSLGSQWYNQDVRVLFQTTGFIHFQVMLLHIAACCWCLPFRQQ